LCSLGYKSFVKTASEREADYTQCQGCQLRSIAAPQFLNFNLFIKQKDRSATYIDMHEIHVETR